MAQNMGLAHSAKQETHDMSRNMGLERILQHEFERVPLQRPRTHFRIGAPELGLRHGLRIRSTT